jgi:hypothetical protein
MSQNNSMMYRILPLVTLFSTALYLTSCEVSRESSENNASSEFEQAQAEQSEVGSQIREVIYDIPSPSEIPFLLQATGAEYNASFVNDLSRADLYSTRNDKAALNLGVYSADIGYLSSYGKVQEALNYMEKSKNLADNLGLSGAFSPELVRRFERNLSRRDSLAYLLNETINTAENFLKDENRNHLAALIIAGSFVEGLYIATQLIEQYPKDILPEDSRNLILSPLIRVVLEQEKATNDLLALLKTIERSQTVIELTEDLEELNKSFEELNIDEQIQQNRADLVLSDETLSDITEKVAEMREYIVE